jgi:hypothetical protein
MERQEAHLRREGKCRMAIAEDCTCRIYRVASDGQASVDHNAIGDGC